MRTDLVQSLTVSGIPAWAPKFWYQKNEIKLICTIILYHRLFLLYLSEVFLSEKTQFLHYKPSCRPSTFEYGATVCATASLRPLVLQAVVCPKNLSIHYCLRAIFCNNHAAWSSDFFKNPSFLRILFLQSVLIPEMFFKFW